MSVLDDNETLSRICVPGSHDAGMYETTNTQKGLALTQAFTLKQPLEHGVRYFDLRPRYYPGEGIFIAHESAIGPHQTKVLADIDDFMQHHPTETIILNFSHFINFDKNGDNDFMIDIKRHLNNYFLAVPHGTDPWTLPLKDLRGKAIILISRSEIFNPYRDTHQQVGLFYNSDLQGKGELILDDYSNKQDYHEMLTDQKGKYNNYCNDIKDKRLFLLNWTLTANGVWGAIGNFIHGATNIRYAQDINPKLVEDFRANLDLFKPSKANKKVNIINMDYTNMVNSLPICRYVTSINK